MVNLIIYFDDYNDKDAQELVVSLLEQKLIASASIDADNEYYTTKDDKISKASHTVITAQTKSLLFTQIEKYVNEKYGKDIPIFSIPITQVNDYFDTYIRKRTKKI